MSSKSVPPPTLANQVSRAVVWNAAFAPVRLLADAIATLLKLTALPQGTYGFLSIFTSVNNGFGTAIDLGTGRALPKYIPETLRHGGPKAMRRLLGVVFAAQLALLALVAIGLVVFRESYVARWNEQIISAEDFSDAVARGEVLTYVGEQIWTLLAITVILQAVSIFYDVLIAYLSSFFKQKALNSVDITAQLLPKLLTIGVLVAGWGFSGLLLAMVVAPIIATGALIWTVFRHQNYIKTLPQPEDSGPLLPPGFIRYCAVSLLMNGSDFIASAGFAILFARDVVDAALLAAGVNIVRMVLGYLYTPMVGVQVPLFTRVRMGEGGTLNGAYQSLIRLQALLLIPGGVGLVLLARPVFSTLLPEYTEAANLVWVLVPCLFIESLLTTAHNALIVYEKLQQIIIARVLTLVCVPLVLLLAPGLGIVGVTLAFGLARVAAGAWVTAAGARLLHLRWPTAFTLRVMLASAIMAAVVAGLNLLLPTLPADASPLTRLLMLPALLGIALVGGLTLLGGLRLSGGLDAADREQLLKLKLPGKKWLARIV